MQTIALKGGETTSFALGVNDYAVLTNVLLIVDGVSFAVTATQQFGPYAGGRPNMRVIGSVGGGSYAIVDQSFGDAAVVARDTSGNIVGLIDPKDGSTVFLGGGGGAGVQDTLATTSSTTAPSINAVNAGLSQKASLGGALGGTPVAPTALGLADAAALTTLIASYVQNSMAATTLKSPSVSAVNAAISAAIANIVNSSPAALDTLNELAAALGNDANFATTITNLVGAKASKNNNLSDLASIPAAWANLSGDAKVLAAALAGIDVTTRGTVDNTKSVLQGLGLLQATKADQLVEIAVTGSQVLNANHLGKILVYSGNGTCDLTVPADLTTVLNTPILGKNLGDGVFRFLPGSGIAPKNFPGTSIPKNETDVIELKAINTWTYAPETPIGSGAGITPLTMTAQVLDSAKGTLVLSLSRAAYQATLPAVAGLTLLKNGAAFNPTAWAYTDALHINATLPSNVAFGDVLTWAYAESTTARIKSLSDDIPMLSQGGGVTNSVLAGGVPGQVTGLTLGTKAVTSQPLTWTAPSGAPTDYLVEYKASSSGTWLTFAHGASSAVAITVTGLNGATAYDFRVSAINGSGTGAVSATQSGSTLPGQVTGLTLGTATGTTQPLTWTPPSGTLLDFIIERSPAGANTWTTFADGTSTVASTTVTGLAAATNYDYRVTAVGNGGNGAASATATGFTAGGVATDFVRWSTHPAANETGSTGAGWVYTATGDTNTGVSDKSLTMAQDGQFEAVLNGTSGFHGFSIDETNAGQDLDQNLYGLISGGGSFNSIITSTVNAGLNRNQSLAVADGDIGAFTLVGNVVLMRVKKAGKWRTIHRFARARGETLYPNWKTFGSPAVIGPITRSVGAVLGARWASNVNLVFDGNSMFAGDDGRSGVGTLMADLAPAVGSGNTFSNVAVTGQTFRQMNGLDGSSAADVDGAFITGRVNILVIWEGTNSIVAFGRTAAQAGQDLADYITARKAAHAWDKIVVVNTIPRASNAANQTVRDANNAALLAFNAYIVTNRVAMGIDAICDLRQAGSPFNMATFTVADFDALQLYFQEGTTAQLHPSDEGNYVVAAYIAATLQALAIA